MKHKIKTVLFKSLALLPNKVDDFCYHKIQSFFDKYTLEDRLKASESTYFRLAKVLNDLNINMKNKIIFEFGSGWFPSMPYFFKYKFEAKKVYTLDINEHFKIARNEELNGIFSKRYVCEVLLSSDNKYSLPQGIEYLPNCIIFDEKFPDLDVIFSRYVLSHMNEKEVDRLHKKMKSELKKGTFVIHFISPSDLREHGDSTISAQDFLKYSREEWDKIHTKFDYHNRLRLPQFLEIFKKYNFEIIHLEFDCIGKETKKYDLFKKIQLHEDYVNYTDEELTAGNIFVILKI